MTLIKNVRLFSALLIALWVTAEKGLAQTETPGVSGGPVSASDQQVQATDLVGKHGQQKVDLFTGSFSYGVPINCAPARNGSEPNLSLAYSSAGDNNWCGMGWTLETGFIDRNVRDGFPIAYSTASPAVPLTQYDDTKGFMLNLLGKAYKLFAVATNAPTVEYRAEVDTDFLRCLLNTNNNSWTVYDKSGTAYYFGETTNTRMANPKPGWTGYGGTFHWALDQIITATGDWTTIAYTNNTSPYTGLPENTLYPTQISYNGHTSANGYSTNFSGPNKIIFQTGVRSSDWHFSFRSGYRTDQCRLLTNILCQAGSQNVWSYSLQYGISPATARSLLTNVIVYGYTSGNVATAYVTNTFAYQANPKAVSFGPTISWTNIVLNTPETSSGSYEANLSDNDGNGDSVSDLVDMDGDGLPDRVNYDNATPLNRYQVQKNYGLQANGNGAFGSRYAFGSTSTGTGTIATNSNPFPNGTSYTMLNSPYGRIRDINGDGLPDRVMAYWWSQNSLNNFGTANTYVPFTNYDVQLNIGGGFSGVANWPVSAGPLLANNISADFYYNVESGGVNVGFFDIDGDGRPDRVMSGWYQNGPMTNLIVQLNTGTNFTQPKVFGPYFSQNFNGTISGENQPYKWAGIETPEAHMIDINGDGLPDRLMYPMNPSSSGNELHPTTYYAVEYNDGFSFESTNTSTGAGGAADQWPGGSGLETVNNGFGAPNDAIVNLPYVGLFDVNGDGLPDRVMLNWAADTNNTTSHTATSWLVFLNNGHGFNSTPIVVTNIENQGLFSTSIAADANYWGMQGWDSSKQMVTTLMDINGDGLLDRVMSVEEVNNGFADATSNFFLVQLNQGPFPDLLTNINNGIGGNIGVTYNSSSAFDNRVDTTNPNSVSHMPFPRQVASAVTASDGINLPQTTTYAYGGGYFDGVRREFHGFAVVSDTDPTLRTTVSYFHTGGGRNYSALGEYQDTNSTTGAGNFAKDGKPYRVESYGFDNELYHVQVNQVDQTSLGNARYFPFETLTFECDYPGNGTPKVTATQFAYDATTGNLTNKIEYGQVNGFNATNVGSFSFTDADTTDTRDNATSYATLTSNSNIVDLPATVDLLDSGNNIIQESKYTYDQTSGEIASKLTRISAGYYATNSYGNYTAYGLVGLTTDPVGVQTEITYDSTYNTYPAMTRVRAVPGSDTTNDFITTKGYDARSGEVAISTDPAGVTISNSFDNFLRPTETDKIAIGGATTVWMKKYAYPAVLQPIVSGLATNYVDVIDNDGVGGFTNRTYIDGFSRTIQTRTEGENGNCRVVSTAYDGRGNAFLTTWPVFSTSIAFAPPATGLTATWALYDAYGRVATNRPVTVTFNSNGAFSSKTDQAGDAGSPLAPSTWSYVNGSDPWWIIYTDEDGQVRRYGLDAFGHTNQIQEVDGASTYTTTLKYDLADNLTNIVNANSENVYWAYNDAGDVVAMADPYLGQTTYQLDYAGRLRVQTDGRGDVISNSYVNASGYQDVLGRLQVQTVYGFNYGSHTLVPAYTNFYVYDRSDDGNYTVYPGLLYKVVDGQGSEKNSYDKRTRTVETTRHLNINNKDYNTIKGYDDGDNVTSITYPNYGPTINYTYFPGKSVKQVSLNGGNYNYYTVSPGNYDEFEHVTSFLYGSTLTTTRSFYSKSKRLQTITAGSGGAVFNRTYQYTPGEDITNIVGTGVTNVTASYYNLHRIKSYTGLTGTYGYDSTGNITNNIEGGSSKYAYANPRIQAVRTAFGYTNLYDLCGNMIVRHGGLTNSQALTYDPENRLSTIAQAGVFSDEFGYAYDDARLWKRINQNPTNVQVWIGNIYEEKGGKTLFHIFAGNEQVCTFEATSSLDGGSNTNAVGYYYTEDNLNTSSALSGSGGTQVEVNAYYPFGRTQTTSPQASFQVSRRFTGQVFDAESGLYYYNARYYDPELGRFIQPDTTVPDMSNPQSYNRYSYCVNDPLRYNDPTGHGPVDDALFNTEAIKSSYQLMTMHDTFGEKLWEAPVGAVGMAANGLDAGFNVLTVGVKGAIEGGIKGLLKVGVKELEKEGTKVGEKEVAKLGEKEASKTANKALRDAKDAHGVPRSAQPDKTIKPGTPEGNKARLDKRNVKQYEYTNNKGQKVHIRQDKPANYNQGGAGNQGPHFNSGPANDKLKRHDYYSK